MADFLRHGMDVEVECGCGHVATLQARAVHARFAGEGWCMHLEWAPRRFRCSRCGGRPVRVGPWGR